MKRALVLSGGGSKGAYEAGFIKALYNDLSIHFDIVTGTSIGALNGAMVVQNDLAALDELWQTLDMDHVFKDKPQLSLSREDFVNSSNMTWNFFKTYLKNKGADVTPFYELVEKLFNEDKFFQSDTDFGLCTVNVNTLKPAFVTKKDMFKENAMAYLLASAACFPVFPMIDINGEKYVDGGYFDNLPIDLAVQMGADEIVVCDLHEEAVHSEYVGIPHVIYSHPFNDPGGFMDFSPASLARNRRLGYLDALKCFGRLRGRKYTFNKNAGIPDDLFYAMVMKDEANRRLYAGDHETPLLTALCNRNHSCPLELTDYLDFTLDILGEIGEMDVQEVYDIPTFIDQLKEKVTPFIKEETSVIESFKNWGNRLSYVGSIVYLMEHRDQYEKDLFDIQRQYPEEYLAARLFSLKIPLLP